MASPDHKLRLDMEIKEIGKNGNQTLYNDRSEQVEGAELEQEIECPRCHDLMILCSDFDSLYYLCEECGFSLYSMKKA